MSRFYRSLIIYTPTTPVVAEFVTVWRTDNPGTSGTSSITIPTDGIGYSYSVDWGDSTSNTGLNGSFTHTYSVPGTYSVRIGGTFPKIYFNNGGDRRKIVDITNWGTIQWTSMANAFYGCSNLQITATDIPNLSAVSSTALMFASCTSLIGNSSINNWNVSNVNTMNAMFATTNFNQPIGNWNVSNVTTMFQMFVNASAFNQDIGSWTVSNVTNMTSMFNGATNFNNGGTSSINNWETSKVNNMFAMFANATNFNQPIGNWNVGTVSNMNTMFNGAENFNQNIGNWDVSKVTDMSTMFSIATNFNNGGTSSINNWNTSKVQDMSYMFQSATNFNQPIGNWNVGTVSNMISMFQGATNFNQNIGGWTVSNVTNFTNFMSTKTPLTFTSSNLDAIYNGWSAKAVKPNISISFGGAGGAKYTAASSAGRAILTGGPNNWTISDGGSY